MFIKPRAVTEQVKDLFSKRFGAEGHLRHLRGHHHGRSDRQGHADRQSLRNDCHQGHEAEAWGSDCAAKGTGRISEGLRSWKDALEQGFVYNLVDGAAAECDKLKKGETMLKFGGGFHCGKVKEVFVINGFYANWALVVAESLDWPNALWTTRCGWRFGAARFSMRRRGASLRPGERVCQRCARMELCA